MVSNAAICVGIVLSTIALSWPSASVHAEDLTTEDAATGEDVVMAVISRLDATGFFPSDHRMMRRIAYVETKYGTVDNDRGGGIWALGENKLDEMRSENFFQGIKNEITDIQWSLVKWNDLSCPLYSGLAARLYLQMLEERSDPMYIPLEGDIEEQANFWCKHYHTGVCTYDLENKFTTEIRKMEESKFLLVLVRLSFDTCLETNT